MDQNLRRRIPLVTMRDVALSRPAGWPDETPAPDALVRLDTLGRAGGHTGLGRKWRGGIPPVELDGLVAGIILALGPGHVFCTSTPSYFYVRERDVPACGRLLQLKRQVGVEAFWRLCRVAAQKGRAAQSCSRAPQMVLTP